MELMVLTQRYPFGMLVLCLAVVAAGNRMPGKEKERQGTGASWSAGFPDFHRKQRVWRRRQERGFTQAAYSCICSSSAQPGVCGPHSSVAALLAVVITGVWIADREPVSGSGLFPPPDILRILYLSANMGRGAGFLPVPGPDSGGPGNHHLCGRQPDYQQCARCPFAVRIFRGLQCL